MRKTSITKQLKSHVSKGNHLQPKVHFSLRWMLYEDFISTRVQFHPPFFLGDCVEVRRAAFCRGPVLQMARAVGLLAGSCLYQPKAAASLVNTLHNGIQTNLED